MLTALLAAAAVAAAPDPKLECDPAAPGQPPAASHNPDWLVKPDYRDIYWAYPRRAVTERVTGRAIIICEVSEQGAAEACKVEEESPKDYGFGEAAVSLTKKMLFRPMVVCGIVQRGTVRIPIAFGFPDVPSALSVAPLDPADTKLALAARLIAAMGLPDKMKAMVDLETLGFIDLVEEGEAELSAEERMALHDAARESWSVGEGKVMNALARALAKRFEEQELVSAVEFYESPVGRKLGSFDESLSDEMEAVYEAIQPDMMLDFRRRYCARVQESCAPEDAI